MNAGLSLAAGLPWPMRILDSDIVFWSSFSNSIIMSIQRIMVSLKVYNCGVYFDVSWYYRVPQTTRLNVRLSRFDALDDNQRPTCKCTSRCCKNYIASYPRNKNCACGAVADGNRVYRYSKVQLGCVPDVSFHYFVFANFCFALR